MRSRTLDGSARYWCRGMAVLGLFMVGPVSGAVADIIVSGDECARLLAHRATPDVEYRAGVDVHGKPVAPADLPGSGAPRPGAGISFDITVNLRQYLGDPAGTGIARYLDQATVASVRVAEDGKVYIDGLLLDDPVIHAIAEECRRRQQAP